MRKRASNFKHNGLFFLFLVLPMWDYEKRPDEKRVLNETVCPWEVTMNSVRTV